MKTKGLKRILILFFLLFFTLAIFSVGSFFKSPTLSPEAEAKIVQSDLKETYFLGEKIELSNSYTVEYDNQTYVTSEAQIIFPDGKVYSSKTFFAKQIGKYAVVGYFSAEEKERKATKFFYVLDTENPDSVPPQITVECERTDSNGIFVKLGDSVKVFKAFCGDNDFTGEIKKAVYYNYGTALETSVSVTGDVFTASRLGVYTIVYTAKDVYGNLGTETLNVTAVDLNGEEPISLSVEKAEEIISGVETVLPAHEASGINGAIKVKITAKHGKETLEIDSISRSFMPSYAGTYVIEYAYSDNVYNGTYSYEVTVVSHNARVVAEVPTLPKYLIKNAAYSFDDCIVYEYTESGPKKLEMECVIAYDGSENYLAVKRENCKITGNTVAKIGYRAKTDADFKLDVCECPIQDVGFGESLQMEKYFLGDFTAEKSSSSILFKSNVKNGNGTLSFINPISFSQFLFNFRLNANYANFAGLKIKLIDYYDDSVSLVYTYTNRAGAIYLSLGETEQRIKGSFDDGTIRFIQHKDGSIVTGDFSETLKNPFLSDLCYLELELSGIEGNAGVEIVKINNQGIGASASDNNAPIIFVSEIDGERRKDALVTIPRAVISDVLSPVLFENTFVSVKMPDGSFAVSEDGVKLDGSTSASVERILRLSQYGKYTIKYTAFDGNCRTEGSKTVFVHVLNDAPPQIRFDELKGNNMTFSGRVGETRTVKTYTTLDDNTSAEALKTYTCVIHNNAFISYNEETFTLYEEGLYTVYAYCIDDAGNSAYAYYNILVGGAK